MTKRKVAIVLGALTLAVLAAVGVRAATGFSAPSTLGYSGTLLTGSAPAADGNYVLTFSLFSSATGGTALWTETHTTVPVVAGRFSVVLGATSAITSATLNSKALWLEISVGSEVLSPRQMVTSVPYAMRSALQCRTVTTQSAAGGPYSGWATATAACDSTETIMGGGCIPSSSTSASYTTFSQSFADDLSYQCVFQFGSGTPAVTQAGQAQARCCKM